MSDLAELLARTDRFAQGEALANRSLAILEGFADTCPANLIKSLTNTAEFRIAAGDLSSADALFVRAISVYESAYQTNQQLLGDVLKRYAAVLRSEKKGAEAQNAVRRAARVLSESQRENHLGYTVEASELLKLPH